MYERAELECAVVEMADVVPKAILDLPNTPHVILDTCQQSLYICISSRTRTLLAIQLVFILVKLL